MNIHINETGEDSLENGKYKVIIQYIPFQDNEKNLYLLIMILNKKLITGKLLTKNLNKQVRLQKKIVFFVCHNIIKKEN